MEASKKLLLKVYRLPKHDVTIRYLYLPKNLSLIFNEPDAFEVCDINIKEGTLVLKAVKKSEVKTHY